MKKILFLVIVSLIFGVCSPVYAFDASVYVGAWAKTTLTDGGGLTYEFFYLTENHKVFYSVQYFGASAADRGEHYVGLWYPKDNGIHVVYGKNLEGTAKIYDDYYLGFKRGTMIYKYGRVLDASAEYVAESIRNMPGWQEMRGQSWLSIGNDDAFAGTWVSALEDEKDGLTVSLFHLTKGHQAYFLTQTFSPGKIKAGRQYASNWSSFGNGKIRITWGDYADSDAFITSDGKLGLIVGDMYYPYRKLASGENGTDKAVYVPAGIWKVGEDIPAGVYSVRNPENVKSQNFFVHKNNPGIGNIVVNSILGSDCPLIGKITLERGYIVEVDKGVYFDSPVALGF